jgi:hypothetical protein
MFSVRFLVVFSLTVAQTVRRIGYPDIRLPDTSAAPPSGAPSWPSFTAVLRPP